jgi:hypothetical protein
MKNFKEMKEILKEELCEMNSFKIKDSSIEVYFGCSMCGGVSDRDDVEITFETLKKLVNYFECKKKEEIKNENN